MTGAIIGLDEVKTAIMCMAVEPGIRCILVRGPPGVGKTAVVRSMVEELTGSRPVIIPQNVTEEQLFGTLDVEKAISEGSFKLEPGLLAKSNGSILTVDDINLLDRRVIHGLLGAVRSGHVKVERDGISADYVCDLSLVATVSSKDVPINKNVLDLFDISVTINSSRDEEFRVQVARSILDEEEYQDRLFSKRVEAAESILDDVTISDSLILTISEACINFGVRGHRGDIATVRTAKALAALAGRTEVNESDVTRALVYCINHRRDRKRIIPKEGDSVKFFGDSHMTRCIKENRRVKTVEAQDVESDVMSGEGMEFVPSDDDAPNAVDMELEDVVLDVGEIFDTIDLRESESTQIFDAHMLRKAAKDMGRDGRYISSRALTEGNTDIAIDATVRTAAPYQRMRREESGRDGLIINRTDLMEKVREKRTACLFLFMIDNSGSLVIRSRMRNVKAAVLSILEDHYVRKDSVGIMTFNEAFIGMVMNPSRSVGGVKKVIEDLSVGKKTPLSEALVYAQTYLTPYLRKHPADRCFVVLMTDALANIPMNEGADPFDEAVGIAKGMKLDRTDWVVVDTSSDVDEKDRARRLAEALNAPYHSLDELRSSNN